MPDANPLPIITTATRADQVFDVILNRILSGEYSPGHPLRELDLVAQMGVSRTPIREALTRLMEYGVVCLENRSVVVRPVTVAEVFHAYQMRVILETAAVRLACGRLAPENFTQLDALAPINPVAAGERSNDRYGRNIHLIIAERSGNPILFQQIRRMLEVIRLAHGQLAQDATWLRREARQHRAIVEALRSADRRASVRAMRNHLRSACRANMRCARKVHGR